MSDDIFKQFSRNTAPDPEQEQQPNPVQATKYQQSSQPYQSSNDSGIPYAAVGLNRSNTSVSRLMLYYQDGRIAVMSYAYLVEVLCTSHQFLSLIFSNCVITLRGYNLMALLELI